ncbi:cadherin domain-containing protein [Sphingomonas suaedae]|uniref:Cadherin domain-containing protein n=1 Tax=Sphingomonas suaedae TaxID=2599297 RepID=A0A518REV5_9SPHN|nr:PQQ-dependent sugar dehydrogenase [Sphingomonas suaedae]QDX25961.1 cadherin domain-containing protein [Sphingomonas suaedae]
MRFTAIGLAAVLVTGCSGGGSGGGTVTPPTNRAPSFTSGATASMVENGTSVFTATATDPDANSLTFSIAGGADGSQFAITAAGALSFATAPNFDLPSDADGDNVYQLQLRVSDGSLSATQEVSVTVTNSREGIAVRRVGTGFDQPLYVAAIPGNTDVYVAEKGGGIWRLDPTTGAKSLLFTVGNLTTDGERGLLGMALPADFATSRRFMVFATGAGGTIELRRYNMLAAGYPPSLLATLSIPHPGANNHNGGWMGFGPDGYLYAAIGDGGGGGDPGNNAQNRNVQLGKILRIEVNTDPYAGATAQFFSPAPGNPFLAGGGDPYVFAYGLRNPFRASFAPDGRLFIGDVGQDAREEIDVLRTDQPGLNFGWRFLEGTLPYSGGAPAGLTAPVTEYAHGTGLREGRSVIGGYVYRGPITSLAGAYVFGDFVSGNIWSVPASSLVAGTTLASSKYERRNQDFAPDAGTIDQLVSFGEDAGGNLYLIDLDGEIFMVTPG